MRNLCVSKVQNNPERIFHSIRRTQATRNCFGISCSVLWYLCYRIPLYFGLEEGWEPLDCIYFAVVTLTTAGLGDFVPTTDANKIICSIFIYFGVACIGFIARLHCGNVRRQSYREEEVQINSCPNCARLQTIREAAKVGSRANFPHSIANPRTR
jgi:hypothetical protein